MENEKQLKEEQRNYVETVSYQIEEAWAEVFLRVPFGIIIYNENHVIEWINPYMEEEFIGTSLKNQSLTVLSEDILSDLHKEQAYSWIYINNLIYFMTIDHDNRILYLFDRTNEKN